MKPMFTVEDLARFQGCLANPHYRAPGLRDLALAGPGAFSEVRKWEDFATCIEDQGRTGMCEAVSATTLVEALMREQIDRNLFAPDLTLDWKRVHHGAWLDANPDRPASEYSVEKGMPLGSSLTWMRKNGLLPDLAIITDVEDSDGAMWDALQESPVQIGVQVHDGFSADRVKVLGEITAPLQIPPLAGHALVVTGQITGKDFCRMDTIANSWGKDWGYQGWAQCHHHTLAWSFIDHPKSIQLLPGAVHEWIALRGVWEGFIVRRGGAG